MLPSIYKIFWKQEANLVYIGQTISEKRFINHLSALRSNSHSNYKLQNTFNLYGEPLFEIIDSCTDVKLLNNLELQWILKYDSVKHGLNIAEGTTVGRGTTAPNSKYSRKTILKIFSMLYRTTLSYAKIEARLGLKKGMPSKIASGSNHQWLELEFPEQYKLLIKNREKRLNINRDRTGVQKEGANYGSIIDPEGVVHKITGTIYQFCEQHPLLERKHQNHISEVLSGAVYQYKGFRLHIPQLNQGAFNTNNLPLKAPNGEIFTIPKGKVAEFCRNREDLKTRPNASTGISAVLRKVTKSYIGYTLA